MQKEEFELAVNLESLSLFTFGVIIVWVWEWSDDSSTSSWSDDQEGPVAEGHFNPHMESELSGDDRARWISPQLLLGHMW